MIGIEQENSLMIIIGITLTWIAGSFLYKNIENRFRKLNKINNSSVLTFGVVITFAITGLILANQEFGLKQTVLKRPINQMDPGYVDCSIMTSNKVCILSRGKLQKILIIGDSHAGSISSTILKNASLYGSVDSFLRSGCAYVNTKYINSIQSESCNEYSRDVERIISAGSYDLIIPTIAVQNLIQHAIEDRSIFHRSELNLFYKLQRAISQMFCS